VTISPAAFGTTLEKYFTKGRESDSVKDALRAVRRSVLTETALALSALAIVAILGTLEPLIAA
jgi:putative copper export protein